MMGKKRMRFDSPRFQNSAFIGLVLLSTGWLAAEEPIAPHQIPRVETRIEVDGVLNEPMWERAWTMTLDYEVHPGENTPAPSRTRTRTPTVG